MFITTLAENTTKIKDLESEHGLSLHFKTKKHSLLFDTGTSTLFAENAEKLNVDLSQVDIAVISHGHYDHGGGLETFLKINDQAKIFIHHNAFGDYYSNRPHGQKAYIGLNPALQSDNRFIMVAEDLVIDEELQLFSNVKGRKFFPSGNQDLFVKNGNSFELDDFSHEQNLIIKEDDKTILVAGCAHNGIINILEHFYTQNEYYPTHVIGGFHLYNPSRKESEDSFIVEQIGDFLLSTNAKFFTCHCTGLQSYEKLKTMMGEKIDYLSTGTQLIL